MNRSTKAEGRRPKEGRSANTKGYEVLDHTSDFWAWADDSATDSMVLHDGGGGPALRPLDERTALFGEAIIRFAKKVPRNAVNNPLIQQLVRAGTSVGANYCEADDAVSGKEFKQKIGTSRKESKES